MKHYFVVLLISIYLFPSILAQDTSQWHKVSILGKAYAKTQVEKIEGILQKMITSSLSDQKCVFVENSSARTIFESYNPEFDFMKSSVSQADRKKLKEKGIDYLIIAGISSKSKKYSVFYRIINTSEEKKEERSLLRSLSGKEVQAALKEAFAGTKFYQSVAQEKPRPIVYGWFEEELSETIQKGKELGNYLRTTDNATMVYVAAGPFLAKQSEETEERNLPSFYIDKYEVSNEQYCLFLNTTQKIEDEKGNSYIDFNNTYCSIEKKEEGYQVKAGKEKHPVISVSWYGAKAYCNWVGGDLPSLDQWNKTLQGGTKTPSWINSSLSITWKDNQEPHRLFPWGNDQPSSLVQRCNYKSDNNVDGYVWTSPVFAFTGIGDSPYRCSNMAGNVWEWSQDNFNQEHEGTIEKQCLGGSFGSDVEKIQRDFHFGLSPHIAHNDLGFRVCYNFEKE